jgi:hypothetical protein
VSAAFGQTLFDYLTTHPDAGAAFNTIMAEQTAAPILEAYPFDGVRRLVEPGRRRCANRKIGSYIEHSEMVVYKSIFQRYNSVGRYIDLRGAHRGKGPT